jgi:adrenodoxin-NADP+ reductase
MQASYAPPPSPHTLLQAACTPKELKELATLDPSIAVHASSSQMAVSEQDAAEMRRTRMKRRIFDIISKVLTVPLP